MTKPRMKCGCDSGSHPATWCIRDPSSRACQTCEKVGSDKKCGLTGKIENLLMCKHWQVKTILRKETSP